MTPTQHNDEMRKRSGEIDSADPLVSFFYELMRDHLTPGVVEKILRNSILKNEEGNPMTYQFTNGWLANMAIDMVQRLR